MSLFRRKPAPAPVDPLEAGWSAGVAVAPIRTGQITPDPPNGGQVQGWAGLSVQLPANYAGAYSGQPVSMRGGFGPGLQRRGGTEGLSAGWYLPPGMAGAGLGNAWSGTQRGASSPGAQLIGGAAGAGLGPANVRTMRGNITAAQIRQSGLAAVQWAQALSPVIGS